MTSPTKIRPVDMLLLNDLFGISTGYVLTFSDRTFAEFFAEEIGTDIDDPRFSVEGTSKGKRLRYFLKTTDAAMRVKTLLALWEYRESARRRSGAAESVPNAKEEFFSLIERLGGKRPDGATKRTGEISAARVDRSVSEALKVKLLALAALPPVQRGFGYERFLGDLFDANGLAPRAPFRLVGEQIDGSFEMGNETYLLEAKWTALPVGAADLFAFNAKVEEKAAWSRGVFVSDSGFSDDGLVAFGRRKSIVCIDGLDLFEMLDKNLSFSDVLARKVRRAAESGNPFVRIRDLYR
jgi:hypothetical protein